MMGTHRSAVTCAPVCPGGEETREFAGVSGRLARRRIRLLGLMA